MGYEESLVRIFCRKKVVFSLPHYKKGFIAPAAVNDWVSEGVLVPYQHCLCSSSQLVDVRSTSDSILTCVQAGRVELSPPDKKPLSPEYVIGDCVWGHHILLGKPYHHHQPPVLLMTSPSTFTTVCFHRILFFSITEKTLKTPRKLFTSQFLIFSVSIMYFPTAHFLLQ